MTEAATTIRLLHGFELRRHGKVVSLPTNAQRLVALLALERRPRLRATVAGTLWADTTDEHAGASLRTALWRARAADHTVIVAGRNQIQIGDDVLIDVTQMIENARRIAAGWESVDVDGGLDAFVGELLPEWGDDWLLVERERVRQIQLHCLEVLCGRLTASGRAGAAIEAGLAAVAIEPLRETAQRVLMEAHLAEGNIGEALRQYDSFRALLRDSLGIDPSASVRDLVAGHR